MNSVRGWFAHRRRPEPPLDVGLAAERTAMAWQRTGLALAALSAMVVHLADRDIVAAVPGISGLSVALGLVVLGERRYAWTVRRVNADRSPLDHRPNTVLTLTVVMLCLAALVLVEFRI